NNPATVVSQGGPEQDDVAAAISQRGQAHCAEHAHVQRAGAELDLHFAGIGGDPVEIQLGLLVQSLGLEERLPGGSRATGRGKRDTDLACVSGPDGREDGCQRQGGSGLKKGSAVHKCFPYRTNARWSTRRPEPKSGTPRCCTVRLSQINA